jgi:hypothetical protein
VYSLAGSVPPLSHLTCWTPTKSNLYLASSLETVVRELTLHKLLIPQSESHIHIPSLGSFIQESVKVRGSFRIFVTNLLLRLRGVSPMPNPQTGGQPLVVCLLGSFTRESVEVRGSFRIFVTNLFLQLRGVSPMPNPQTGGQPLVVCLQLLIQYIRSRPT